VGIRPELSSDRASTIAVCEIEHFSAITHFSDRIQYVAEERVGDGSVIDYRGVRRV
jgi:hypothetical protein